MYRSSIDNFSKIYNVTYNVTYNIFYNLQDKLIELYKSILIQPQEEIEMIYLDISNVITTQPTNQVN